MNLLKIVIYSPLSYADKIREVLDIVGAGHIGNYDFCSFSVKGIGRFRPLDEAQPFVGAKGTVQEVEEERIETVCMEENVKKILDAVRQVHPYEEPVIDVYHILNYKF